MSSQLKKLLDRFAPIMGGLGAFVGVRLLETDSPLAYYLRTLTPYSLPWYLCIGIIPAIFSYLFCTCTHRKYLIYSSGGLGAFVGSLIGMGIGAPLCPIMSSVSIFVFTFTFAAVFTHIFHKEGSKLQRLDRYAPMMSGLGAFVGFILSWMFFPLFLPILYYSWSWHSLSITFIPAIFSYLFCTCTHRKYLIYSRAAVGAFIGSLVGKAIGEALVFQSRYSHFLSMIICIPLFATLFTYIFHKKSKAKGKR
ncbi:MAG: hypothetical protein AB1485_02055 [Candidatus Thermoplasmatota archaeon]